MTEPEPLYPCPEGRCERCGNFGLMHVAARVAAPSDGLREACRDDHRDTPAWCDVHDASFIEHPPGDTWDVCWKVARAALTTTEQPETGE